MRGGEPRALLQENVPAFDSIAVDASYVYFTIPGENQLDAVTGGSHVRLAGGEVNPRDLRVDAYGLYWISLAGTSLRLKVREHGGRILSLALEAGPFALDETHVYFADATGLARVPKTGGASQQVTRLPGRALEVALHASHVYAVVPESPTRIYRVPK